MLSVHDYEKGYPIYKTVHYLNPKAWVFEINYSGIGTIRNHDVRDIIEILFSS